MINTCSGLRRLCSIVCWNNREILAWQSVWMEREQKAVVQKFVIRGDVKVLVNGYQSQMWHCMWHPPLFILFCLRNVLILCFSPWSLYFDNLPHTSTFTISCFISSYFFSITFEHSSSLYLYYFYAIFWNIWAPLLLNNEHFSFLYNWALGSIFFFGVHAGTVFLKEIMKEKKRNMSPRKKFQNEIVFYL